MDTRFPRVFFVRGNPRVRQLVGALLSGQLALVLTLPPGPLVENGAPLVAPLAEDVHISSLDGRILRDRADGVTLATVRGTALLNPAPPITRRGQLPRRDAVPRGTTFRILATGYSSTPDQTDRSPFITASGSRVHDGTVAVNFLPFGTKVRFRDYRPDKIFVVEDRHSPLLSSRADIWFEARAAAFQFGARVLLLEVVD